MLKILSNAAQATDVLIEDVGLLVPNSGGFVAFTLKKEILKIAHSEDLVLLATDNAFSPLGSTLIINDGTQDIPAASISTFVQNLHI